MNGYNKKYGEYMNKADKKEDVIKGIKKYLAVGMYNQVTLLEKELHEVYGMSYGEIEEAIYAQSVNPAPEVTREERIIENGNQRCI